MDRDSPDESKPELKLVAKDGRPVAPQCPRRASPIPPEIDEAEAEYLRNRKRRMRDHSRANGLKVGEPRSKVRADRLEQELALLRRKQRAWKPTNKQRHMVSLASAAGLNAEEIAGVIGVGVFTLRKYCKEELAAGCDIINARVARKLYDRCMKGDTIALIYWTKARMGWRDRQTVEHVGRDGGPLQLEHVQAEADAFTARINSMAERFAKVMTSDADETPPANSDSPAEQTPEAAERAAK
ncbi:MAG: hypothetical protein DMF06_05235 [Verrucomicrobia bacterium]|nr:MAG: hypothetical protein DMF06_05235 [Verrucomicrobiota bacterium]